MIIGVDASRAVKKQQTGTEKYSRDLIFSLANIDKSNAYRLYVGPDYSGSFDNLPKNFQVILINRKKFWTQIGLSLEMIKNKPDVLFVPSHVLPPICPEKTVVTVHDLGWKYFPRSYSKQDIKMNELGIKRAIKKKSKIIVYSNSTLQDLKKFYNAPDNLIHFVQMGYSQVESSGAIKEDIKKLSQDPYILFVGRLEAKKNIINLVKAYSMLRSERKIRHRLILVGKPGIGYEEIKKEISETKSRIDIIQTGFVTDSERDFLYKHASIFVFPSLYEGFGFPILEAFASGVPVVASNSSSIPEVAGNGAILVNPKKPFEITAAMSQIINKQNLKDRLTIAGTKQLSKFSWENCAADTLNILQSK